MNIDMIRIMNMNILLNNDACVKPLNRFREVRSRDLMASVYGGYIVLNGLKFSEGFTRTLFMLLKDVKPAYPWYLP